MNEATTGSPAWLLKCAAVGAAVTIMDQIFPSHPHLALGIGSTGGVLIQHFIPPRGRSRHLFILLALALLLTGLRSLIK